MSDIEKPAHGPTEKNFAYLITCGTKQFAVARTLGRALWQVIDHANNHPSLWTPHETTSQEESVATTRDHRVDSRVGAYLSFVVAKEFEPLEGTPEWLPKLQRAELTLDLYDYDLPEDLTTSPHDQVDDTTILISHPASPYDTYRTNPRQRAYAATYPEGSRLDSHDTQKVIDILELMAEKDLGIS